MFLGWRGWESGLVYGQVQGKQQGPTAAGTGLGLARVKSLFSPKQEDIRTSWWQVQGKQQGPEKGFFTLVGHFRHTPLPTAAGTGLRLV